MKRYKALAFICLFLALSLPAAASTNENSADKTLSAVAQQEKKIITESSMLAGVAPGENSEVEPPSIAAPHYNLQAYNTNEVASKAVEKNIGLFSNTIRDRFSLWLSRSGKYLDMMKEILRQKDVPENIVFLSLIESGFNPGAYSVAHAAGPWQFIASTARRYGLEINWWKDERRDPVKSTGAAASYLKDLYKMFGSWNLAMAAYNAGEGRIQKAMKRSNADNYWALLGTKHIKTETKEYVPRFIAASLIATNPGEFGFDEIEYHEPLSFDEVDLNSPIDLSVAAECAGATVEEIRRLNPELRRWCTPPDVPIYTLKIPEGTKEQFFKALASIPENERFTIERYAVKKGETFSRIAKKTGVPVPVILSLNSMEKIMPLKTGSVVYLPPKGLYSLDSMDRSLIKKAAYRKVSSKKKVSKVSTKNSSKTEKSRKI
ncbi:MAG: lytic transglycosylase [Nitrospira bacterium HGW-Nitrospira-1]|nr:MAG: lytic transglycosylase [Nitrospira bacterium HGW-Nitrospira-1]